MGATLLLNVMACTLVAVAVVGQMDAQLGTQLNEAMLTRLRNELRATGVDDVQAIQQIAALLGAQSPIKADGSQNAVAALPSELLNTLQSSQTLPTSSSTCLQQCGVLFTADWLTVLRDPAVNRLVQQVQPSSPAQANAVNPIQSLLSSLGSFDRDDRQLIVDSMCKVQNSLSRCMSKCSVDVVSQAAVVGMRSTEMMCEEDNKNQYVEVLPCLLEVQQKPEAIECTLRQQALLAAARTQQGLSRFDQLNKACVAAEEHTECIRRVILEHCHASAATMLNDLSERTVGLSLRLLNNYDGELPQTCTRYQHLAANATLPLTTLKPATSEEKMATTTVQSFRVDRRSMPDESASDSQLSGINADDAPSSFAFQDLLSGYTVLAMIITLLFCSDRLFR